MIASLMPAGVDEEEVRKYLNAKQARNEAIDIEVGNLAAFRLHPRNMDALEDELENQQPINAPPPPSPHYVTVWLF